MCLFCCLTNSLERHNNNYLLLLYITCILSIENVAETKGSVIVSRSEKQKQRVLKRDDQRLDDEVFSSRL